MYEIFHHLNFKTFPTKFPFIKEDINEWMANFDNTEEEEEEAEEGWTKVGKKKTVRMTEEEQNAAKQKVAKKRKKQQLVRFINFKETCWSL